VNSELFDHTSLIQFLEARFGHGRPDLRESNITPWRRAVTGDLTSAFDFRTPNTSWRVKLPDTDDLKPEDLTRQPDQVLVPPADPAVPDQERGVRPARAIPYTLHVDGRRAAGRFALTFRTLGTATGVFQVRTPGDAEPRTYTVEPGKTLSDSWDATSGYDLSVHGPNGFFRHFEGGLTQLDVQARYDERRGELVLQVRNGGAKRAEVKLTNRYGGRVSKLSLKPGETDNLEFALHRTRGWYDVTVTSAELTYRYAGHLEDGRDSISDPGMGGLI
jgi:phospholipase C